MASKGRRIQLPRPRLQRNRCTQCGRPAKNLLCEVCGEDQLQRTRDAALKSHQHLW